MNMKIITMELIMTIIAVAIRYKLIMSINAWCSDKDRDLINVVTIS